MEPGTDRRRVKRIVETPNRVVYPIHLWLQKVSLIVFLHTSRTFGFRLFCRSARHFPEQINEQLLVMGGDAA